MGAGFIQRFGSIPSQQQIQAIEGVVIVDGDVVQVLWVDQFSRNLNRGKIYEELGLVVTWGGRPV